MRKIMVVVPLVQQLQHGFTKNAKVSPNLTVAHLSILFLNTLTLLAYTHSADNLFHTLMVLWENENFIHPYHPIRFASSLK